MSDYSIKKEFNKKFLSEYGENLDILQLVKENNELKQQILDAENVIKVYDELMLTYKSHTSEIAKKYWSRYERKE